jgi:hypothetical protein
LEFALAWSRKDAKRAEAERARLGLCVNLDNDEEDDAGPRTSRRRTTTMATKTTTSSTAASA